MKKDEIIKFIIIRAIGNFLVLLTVFGFFATFGPTIYLEFKYRFEQIRGVQYITAEVPIALDTKSELGKLLEKYKNDPGNLTGDEESKLAQILTQSEKEKILIPKSVDFSIVIPKIGASAKVFSNVDVSNEKEYLEILQKGVAHASGTVFPGSSGNIYLFAHSADNWWNVGRYNAVFYLLKELTAGDEVIVFFYGKRYNYTVYDSKIIEPENVEYLQPNLGGGERLILQTCWPPGTTWKRQLVFAKPK